MPERVVQCEQQVEQFRVDRLDDVDAEVAQQMIEIVQRAARRSRPPAVRGRRAAPGVRVEERQRSLGASASASAACGGREGGDGTKAPAVAAAAIPKNERRSGGDRSWAPDDSHGHVYWTTVADDFSS